MAKILSRFNTNGARLFLKGLITAWVPIVQAFGIIDWDTMQAVLVMGASTYTVDSFFYMFGIGDKAPTPPEPPTP